MLKIDIYSPLMGKNICLRNSWRTQIANYLGKDEESFPFNFKIIEIENGFCLCESISDNKSKKKFQVYLSELVVHYLDGIETPDVNVGLYFNDYLPTENNKLLILNPKNSSILPVLFKLDILNKNLLPCLDFQLVELLSGENYTVHSQMKNSWKLLHGSDLYMSDTEKMYQDTFVHKEYVVQVGEKFAKYLEENGLTEDAKMLRERTINHDNSKILNKDEFRALTNIINDKSCLGDAHSKLSAFKQDSIELHWKHNSHHPEHFENYEEMSRMDRLEMVCDWMARSLQYKNDLLSFVETRQIERFHFPELMYEELFHFCKVLVSLYT